ncbi:MAG: carboxypeptidase regulatory-like domain-containing protein [Pyrinomonadaceae bacterium]
MRTQPPSCKRLEHVLTQLLCSLLLIVAAAGVQNANAQSESGSAAIEGVVVDGNGAAVAGASVTIHNSETGLERVATTDNGGRYGARVLPVGRYSVRIEAGGFSVGSEEGVVLRVGETTVLNLTLRPAAVKEHVDVTSDGETIDSQTHTTEALISQRLVTDLPVRGRNFTEFVQLTPAVVQESDRSGLVIAGQRSINSNVAIDGADFNDALQGNQRGGNESVFFFPQTAVREFQVVRSGANAEVGRTNAGFVNVVTKSGTNGFHGEAFYFNRNRHFTSPDAFGQHLNNAQNQFGGSIGGPLKKDRAFFFLGVEQNFLRVPFVVQFQSVPGVALTPELAARQGEQRGTNNPTAFFGRTDFVLNQKHTLNTQYTYTRFRGENFNFDTARQDTAVEDNYTRHNSSNGLKGSLVSVLSPGVINEIRAQVATDNRLEEPNSTAGQAVVVGFGTLGGDRARPRLFDTTRFQITDNLSYDTGKHNFRFGFDANVNRVRQQRESNTQPRFDFENRTVGGIPISGLENLIAVRPRRFRQTFPVSSNPEDLIYHGTQREFALFAQDKIKISKELTINAGLRWEAQFNPQPKNPNPAFPQTARIPNDTTQFQPRLGFAYDLGGNSKTLIRVSTGIFTARTPANLFQRVTTDNGLTTQEIEIAETTPCRNSTVVNLAGCRLRGPNAIVTYPNRLTAIPTGFIVPARVFGFDSSFKNPRSFQTSATIEQKVGNDLVFTAGYIHNSTWNLQRRLDRNLFPPTLQPSGFPIFATTRPNPTIAQLEINESSAHSRYDGLTLSLRRRFARRYQFEANYTFAKNRDDDSNERNFSRETTLNPFNLQGEVGPSKQDVRHNLNLSGLVDLGHGFTTSAIVVTRSGFPYTALIEDGTDTNNDLNDANERAVVNGLVSQRFGFRQPQFFNLDLRLLKGFRFGETKRLDLSAELYNTTRNTNKGFGVDSLANFCTANSNLRDTANPLTISCPSGFFPNIRAQQPTSAPSTARFGGARQLQIGLRFVF